MSAVDALIRDGYAVDVQPAESARRSRITVTRDGRSSSFVVAWTINPAAFAARLARAAQEVSP